MAPPPPPPPIAAAAEATSRPGEGAGEAEDADVDVPLNAHFTALPTTIFQIMSTLAAKHQCVKCVERICRQPDAEQAAPLPARPHTPPLAAALLTSTRPNPLNPPTPKNPTTASAKASPKQRAHPR
jgi:hypothetical protein